VVYQYGFESGASGWTSSGTGNTWTLSTANPYSGVNHYRGAGTAGVTDQRLVSPAVVLPVGENPVVLKFWHAPNLETSPGGCYDAGILEISTNGGASWAQVPNANLLVGGYTGTVSNSWSNPLGGLQGWCGPNPAPYGQTIADMSAYAGQTVQFRWRIGTDSSVTRPGWDVDDVTVQSCQMACIWDVNQSGFIDIVDIQMVTGAWGETDSPYDFDGNGVVDIDDVLAVASRWNTVCGP
jgi:hypothetical protein